MRNTDKYNETLELNEEDIYLQREHPEDKSEEGYPGYVSLNGEIRRTSPEDILLIEDNPQHKKSAELFFNKVRELGDNINVDYAENFIGAQELLRGKVYDGIISDVFFPYNSETIEGDVIEGWNEAIAKGCKKTLLKFLKARGKGAYLRSADEKWMEGKEMSPTGVVIYEMAKKNYVPVVLCTDKNHHDDLVETVHQAIGLVDDKNWNSAYRELCKEYKDKYFSGKELVNGVWKCRRGWEQKITDIGTNWNLEQLVE